MEKKNAMEWISAQIVGKRYVIYLLFAVAVIYCVLSIGRVKINSDITALLSPQTETRQGLIVMEEEFTAYASANVMVANITYEAAEALAEELRGLDAVTDVAFDDTGAHYVHASALFTISFDGEAQSERVAAAMNAVRARLSGYDLYVNTTIGVDPVADIAAEMVGVLLLAAAVIVTVLLLTSRSYFEVVIFFIVFVVSAVLNMGTNFWLGEISSITNSIAVILQLALAIDYAIIFGHLYQDEAELHPTREALEHALARAIVEISSSSLTTIAGLGALTLMQFRLGYDLGLVLSKGIVCSMLTVFLLMPGLIMLFPRVLRRTTHKTLIPDIRPWGRFLTRSKYIFVWIFLLVVPFSFYCSQKTEYAFSEAAVDELTYSESRAAMHKITDTFDDDTQVAVLVPAGDFEAEKAILREIAALPKVKNTMGLAGIEIETGHVLTDLYTPRMFSELLGIPVEEATLLYQAYGVQHEEYQPLFGESESYAVPLVDMFLYLFEKSDQGIVNLEGDTKETMEELRATLQRGIVQLRGEHWSRLVLTASVPVEGEESLALVESVRAIAEKYYGAGTVLVIGNITSARDLADAFNSDNLKIGLLTIFFVFVILLFTLRSVVGSVVLVFAIQACIWINFAFPYLQNVHTFFVTNTIVTAIQMGATIDYAIVLMNRYLVLRQTMDAKAAVVEAVHSSFATVLTSGSIMTVAGILLAYRVTDVYIAHIGLAVGRGALISVILVLTVLPQLICLLDGPIRRTSFVIRLNGGREKE